MTLPYNLGIGGAVQTGYRFAWEGGYDLAVRLDGASVSPEDLVAHWKAAFPTFWPKGATFYAPLSGIAPGEVALLGIGAGLVLDLGTKRARLARIARLGARGGAAGGGDGGGLWGRLGFAQRRAAARTEPGFLGVLLPATGAEHGRHGARISCRAGLPPDGEP